MTADDPGHRRVTIDDIEAARERLASTDIVQSTPVDYSRSLGRRADAEVYLKFEHLQRTGSFKTRGAYNKLSRLVEADAADTVVAASAGNHAQGVALAATTLGLDATIVMPRTAPQAKVEATEGYGAAVVLEGTDFQGAVAHARTLADGDRTAFVPAYDDPDIVAGQGTLAFDLLDDVPKVDTVVLPIGGGGLVGGTALALKHADPSIRVIGVQADDAATVPTSLDKGHPCDREDVDTIADGIATGNVSELTLGLIREHVDEVVTVSDAEIAHGILLLLERAKQLVEGAGAATAAAVLSEALDVSGETVVPVLSGGNLDMTMLRTILTHELTARSQNIRLRVRIDDEPGRMHELSGVIADRGANIRTVHHHRSDDALDVGEAFLVFLVETSGASQAADIAAAVEECGYRIERIN
ncbi:threonine ammonia-lyase [Halomarina oriensis]|uniref:threonine ammonia-lyase n=1 Tax=Halomarina oriensis TaxID=671145 RepID=A0A6B0GJ49_9EURY|nr:threonine ammonia-lyase [Halomarina oriensis]MWG33851.1 threonine ammonia-lyase [Halomarina oriensis]